MFYTSGWNVVLTLFVALLCGQSKALWPFTSVHAAIDAQDNVYPDASAKRVAIIGTLSISLRLRLFLLSYMNVFRYIVISYILEQVLIHKNVALRHAFIHTAR
jgi:hypothetical protein